MLKVLKNMNDILRLYKGMVKERFKYYGCLSK